MRLQLGMFVCALAGAALGVLFCSTQLGAQTVILESASLGATGHISGSSVTIAQFVGWRFQINAALDVDRVGGHLLGDPNSPGGVFAALVALDSITAVLHGAPFTADETIATTVFQPAFPSDEIEVPLTTALQPGSYALVFGTGLFSASGAGALPNFDDQPDIPPTDISSYIFWSRPFQGLPFEWRQNLASHMRFVVDAHVPIPGDYNHDGIVDAADYVVWRKGLGTAYTQSDYGVWRSHFGQTAGSGAGASAYTAVPEPATSVMLMFAAAGWYLRRGRPHREYQKLINAWHTPTTHRFAVAYRFSLNSASRSSICRSFSRVFSSACSMRYVSQ